MGGIFGKNKRLCVLPKRVTFSKGKGKKTPGTARMFCDASTWTGENYFHSARIGRTPKSAELSAAKLALVTSESESAARAEWETGEQAASLRAQHTEAMLSVTARDTGDVEVLQDPEAKPSTEVMQRQELAEQPKEAAESARRSPQESSKMEAVLTPPGSCIAEEQLGCGDHKGMPLAQTIVKAEVHVSADVQGRPGQVQSALLESEMLTGAEQGEEVVCVADETCAGKTHQGVPGQKAADPTAPLHTMEETELPLDTTETREGVTDVQGSAEELVAEEKVCCAAQASPDLQMEPDAEVSITENREENAFEAEEGEEMAEVCDDGKTSEEILHSLVETQAALQGEKIQASKGGKPEEH